MTGRSLAERPPAPERDAVEPDGSGRRAVRRGLRPEVQALRALAVGLVVVYHLNPSLLPGGFVGVDVFFVISGFLITGHLMREVSRTGRVRLRDFWAARARRILPAALVVTVVVVLASLLVLPSTRWADVGVQAVASTLYAQNWVLAQQSVDYLAQDAAATPLQHFWSLAVEEQFYVLWPLLVVAAVVVATRRGLPLRAVAAAAMSLVVVASFATSVLWTATGSPAAYFVTPTRVWELAVGGLLAVALGDRSPRGRVFSGLLAWAGLAAIGVSAVVLDGSDFPGSVALAPVLGAAAVIAAGRTAGAWTPTPLVDLRPVQRLGDVSYSLYLWHWPLILLVPAALDLPPSRPLALGLAAASVVAALASYRFVEQPLRTWSWPRRRARRSLLPALAAMTAVCLLALVPLRAQDAAVAARSQTLDALLAPDTPLGAEVVPADGLAPFPTGVTGFVPDPATEDEATPRKGCRSLAEWRETKPCTFGSTDPGAPVVALVGDSHAAHWFPAVEPLARERGWRLVTYLHNSCPFNAEQRERDVRGGACAEANAGTLEELTGGDVDLVITSAWRGSDYVDTGTGEAPGVAGFAEQWRALLDAGVGVVVVEDTPEPGQGAEVVDCLAEHYEDPAACATARDEALRNADPLLRAAELVPDVTVLRVLDRFCDDETCPAVVGNLRVPRDQNHVTTDYAASLLDVFEAQVPRL
ncbi:acyltransferase family protein [Pseudokineococcus marinus]|uniref:Acyltransferase n=1 Tax=Pseudokineococcus marinus TaxID=351215 RepID=A0A849BU76_9ACTN|nr:acyltransferase family protein [Pseudokineococcus marinus]NNH23974.1 acyltransferase [Pseudokineococcus marinus]